MVWNLAAVKTVCGGEGTTTMGFEREDDGYGKNFDAWTLVRLHTSTTFLIMSGAMNSSASQESESSSCWKSLKVARYCYSLSLFCAAATSCGVKALPKRILDKCDLNGLVRAFGSAFRSSKSLTILSCIADAAMSIRARLSTTRRPYSATAKS